MFHLRSTRHETCRGVSRLRSHVADNVGRYHRRSRWTGAVPAVVVGAIQTEAFYVGGSIRVGQPSSNILGGRLLAPFLSITAGL